MILSASRANVRKNILWYLVAGAGGGMFAGFLGIGGGIILVPVLVTIFGFSQHRAHGTSLAVIIPTVAAGMVVYILRGDCNWLYVASIGIGSIVGVCIGARLMIKIPAYRLRHVFGIYTITVAVLLLLKTYYHH